MLIRNSIKNMTFIMSIALITKGWAVSCPIPATQIKAEWFQISSDKKQAHAKVRDNNLKLWSMNIFSKGYDLDTLIIQRTLEANGGRQQEALSTLGCLRCTYSSSHQFPVDFWACGSK